jgi:hypothetical protein
MPPPPAPKPKVDASSAAVDILWNKSSIKSIVGPTPFLNISRSTNRNPAGLLEYINTNITLTGKIAAKTSKSVPSTGVKGILGAADNLKNLFTKCDLGDLEILCNNQTVAIYSGVRFASFDIDKSNDNWIYSSDYTIQLEYKEPGRSGLPVVENTQDSWSIEPLEDLGYVSWDKTGISAKTEGQENTKRKGAGTNNVKFINLPQFRISHRISAVGLVQPANSNANPNTKESNTTTCALSSDPNKAFLNAKNWVLERLKIPFSGNVGAYINSSLGGAGAGAAGGGGKTSLPFGDIYLYNHLRSTNFSLTDGSYEVNDTWLGFPSGIAYTEDFSIETSTNENYTVTVRVQGTVKGLETDSISTLTTGTTPDGSGKLVAGFLLDTTTGQLAQNGQGVGKDGLPSLSQIGSFKYNNALSGWQEDIKPYLYVRACAIINSSDRTKDYINNATSKPPQAPINPIYAKQALLNVIPVSTTEGHSIINGTITYSYEFNNKHNAISGTISESINISDDGPTDVIAETFVIGRELGPVLQKMGKTSARKSVTVEVAVVPPSSLDEFSQTSPKCPLYISGYIYETIDSIVEGLKPFGDRVSTLFPQSTRANQQGQVLVTNDSRTWNPSEGRYSRSVSWTYQRCTIGDWMNH